MSKYRAEFNPSRLQLALQLLTYMLLALSVLNWQADSMRYQFLLQVLLLGIIIFFTLKTILDNRRKKQSAVIFSQHGEWIETDLNEQTSWRMTDKSRVSSLVLFIHLISSTNTHHAKWRLIYKDQITERNYRRLCCAVIYQQQTSGEE